MKVMISNVWRCFCT